MPILPTNTIIIGLWGDERKVPWDTDKTVLICRKHLRIEIDEGALRARGKPTSFLAESGSPWGARGSGCVSIQGIRGFVNLVQNSDNNRHDGWYTKAVASIDHQSFWTRASWQSTHCSTVVGEIESFFDVIPLLNPELPKGRHDVVAHRAHPSQSW